MACTAPAKSVTTMACTSAASQATTNDPDTHPPPVGASLLAMVVNDDAGNLNDRVLPKRSRNPLILFALQENKINAPL